MAFGKMKKKLILETITKIRIKIGQKLINWAKVDFSTIDFSRPNFNQIYFKSLKTYLKIYQIWHR